MLRPTTLSSYIACLRVDCPSFGLLKSQKSRRLFEMASSFEGIPAMCELIPAGFCSLFVRILLAAALAIAALVRPAAAEDCAAYRDRVWKLEGEKTQLELDKQKMRRELEAGEFCSICKNSKSEIESATGKPFSQHLEKVKGSSVAAPPELILRKEAAYDAKIESKRREIAQNRQSFNECETRERNRLHEERLANERRTASEQRERSRDQERTQREEEDRERSEAESAEQARREAAARTEREAQAEQEAQQRRQQEEAEERERRENDRRAAMEAESLDFEAFMAKARSGELPLEALIARVIPLSQEVSRVAHERLHAEFQSDRWYELGEMCDMLKEQRDELGGIIRLQRINERERREEQLRQRAAEEASARAAEESRVEAERRTALALQSAAEQAGVRLQSGRNGSGAGSVLASGPSAKSDTRAENAVISLFIGSENEGGSGLSGLTLAASSEGNSLMSSLFGGEATVGGAGASPISVGAAVPNSALSRVFDDPPTQVEASPRSAFTAILAGLLRERYNREREARILGVSAVAPASAARARAGALDYVQEHVLASSIPESVRLEGDAWRMLFLPRAVGDTMGAANGHVAFAERWVFARVDAELPLESSQVAGSSKGGGISRTSGAGAATSASTQPMLAPAIAGQPSADTGLGGPQAGTAGVSGVAGGSSTTSTSRVGSAGPRTGSRDALGSVSANASGESRSGSALTPRLSESRIAQARAMAQWASRASSDDEHLLATLSLLEATDESNWPEASRSMLYLHAAAALDLRDPEACRKALAALQRRNADQSPTEQERQILEALRRMQ